MGVKDLFDGFQSATQFVVRRVVVVTLTFGVLAWASGGRLGHWVITAVDPAKPAFTNLIGSVRVFDGLIGEANRQNALFIAFFSLSLGVLHLLYGALRRLAEWCPIHTVYTPYIVVWREVREIERAYRYYSARYNFYDFRDIVEYKALNLRKGRFGWWFDVIWIARVWLLLGGALLIYNAAFGFDPKRALVLCAGCILALMTCAAIEARAYQQWLGSAVREVVTEMIADAREKGDATDTDFTKGIVPPETVFAAVRLDLLIPYVGSLGTWWLNSGRRQWMRAASAVAKLAARRRDRF